MIELFYLHTLLHITIIIIIALRYSTLPACQYWYDYKLQWEPSEYGEVNMLHVPSDHIWRPDISLYNK